MKPRAKALSLERPSRAAAAPSGASSRAARKAEEGEARIVVNVPAALHRALKMRAAERGITVKAYVLELLEREGLK